jgi:lipoprotein-anchoring transpeptidase ErfK/SrfK
VNRGGRRRRVVAAIAVAALAGAVAGAGLAHRQGDASTPRTALPGATALPGPTASGLTIPDPRPLPDQAHTAVWAPVRRAVVATERPRAGSAVVAPVEERTPEGTTNLVLVIGRTTDAAGRVWLRARLPALPAGATGWIPRDAAGGYVSVDTRLVVDRATQTLTLTRGGRVVMTAPVGVGTPGAPTPAGEFYVRNRLTRYRSPAYGPIAFGTSARSPTLTDWPAGGFIGIHGTDQPQILPGRVSHGCIRLRNGDILRLARLMPVGTPLTIV